MGELVIRFIRGSREAMNKKRNFDGVGTQASHGGTWDMGGYRNSEAQNGSRFGGRCGSGRDRQNGGGGGGRGGNGPTTTPPPPTKTDRNLGLAVRTEGKEVGWRRRDDGLMGMGSSVRPAVRRPQENLGPAIGRPQRGQYIELEGRYLREAIRQAPTGEGAAIHQAPTDERETSVRPAIRRPQEKVRPAVRRPQEIVRLAIAALTVRSAIGAHKRGLPLWRSQ